MEKFTMTTGQVAISLEISSDHVRRLAEQGRLNAIRVGKGLRLFNSDEVERLRAERENRVIRAK